MAKYFKYKSPEDIASDAARLGQPLAVSDSVAPLFEPVSIGNLRAGNRLVIHPMEGCDGTLDGRPDELTYRRYVRFGAGGAKVIWAEATAVCPEARANSRQLLASEATLPDLARMLEGCRAAHREAFGQTDDLVVGLQLTHSGRYSVPRPLLATHDPILDPLTLDRTTGNRVDASYPLLSDDDLQRLEDHYVAAALLAQRAGFDFVDLKQCHRYLLSELLGATNRPGQYGGSLENRTRLIRNIIGKIKAAAPQLTLATRMNCYDGIPFRKSSPADDAVGEACPHENPLVTAFGTDRENFEREDLTEPIQVATRLAEWGISLINVSMGNPYSNPHVVRPAEFPPVDGYHAPEHPLVGVLRHFRIARQIQAAVPQVPVVGGGYSWLQDHAGAAAAANVAAREVALVGFGRATLSHPDFARALQETGRFNRKLVCRTFSYCTGLMRAKHNALGQFATGCPPFDKAVYGPLWDEVAATRPPS